MFVLKTGWFVVVGVVLSCLLQGDLLVVGMVVTWVGLWIDKMKVAYVVVLVVEVRG